MNKLTLIKGKAIACLILMCLFMAQSCKKDRKYLSEADPNGQLISTDVITKWQAGNPAAEYFALDWQKARQAQIQGKNVVRVPLMNIDKISIIKGRSPKSNSNLNYNEKRPPEVFFIQDSQNGKLRTYLLNFIPKDNMPDDGHKGQQTGKLYEWNFSGDTIAVQNFEKGKLIEKYLVKYGVDPQLSDLNATVKQQKLQTIRIPKNKLTGNIFTWLLDKVEDFVGWAGHFFGASTWSSHNIFGQTVEDGGWRINGNNTATDYIAADDYSGSGGGGSGEVYNSFLQYSDPNSFEVYPHGPNVVIQNFVADYVASKFQLDYDSRLFLYAHLDIAEEFRKYGEVNPIGQNEIDFIKWGIEYLREDDSRFNQAFKDFLNGSDATVAEDENDNSALNVNIPSNLTPTFSSNGFGVYTTNSFQTDTYPETHPVSVAIANYNEWIYRALIGANNTSVKHLHLNSKGLAGSDAYAKGIGAIGEGIFAQRVTTEYPTSPGGNMYIGYYINTTHIDALQEHFLPGVGGSYYGLQINYTDIYGNPLSKKMEYPDPSHSTTLEKGRIAYEIKTNNVNRNSASTLYQTFLMGINQTVHRANISGIDAGVLVMDFDAWKKLINSSYNQQVIARLNEVYNIKNSNNEQKIYVRIEKNLWSDANKAYWDILNRIKNL